MTKKIGNFILFAIMALLFVSLIPHTSTVGAEPSTATITGVTFGQVSFYLDGVSTLNSDWGVVNVNFTGSADIQYLNLISNGVWSIQNFPVMSIESDGVEQTQRFWFPLGVPSGTEVKQIACGLSIVPRVVDTPPASNEVEPVNGVPCIVDSGTVDVPQNTAPPPATVFEIHGPVLDWSAITYAFSFPNQECGLGECVPAAVSNSLNNLNAKYDLGMNPGNIGIDKMKKATGWALFWPDLIGGCYSDHNDSRPAGQQNAWWEDKDAYMKANNLPITTEQVLPKDIGTIGADIKNGQAVEMCVDGHVACVMGVADLGGGNYAVTVAHDTKQGQNGGCVIDAVVWNSTTNEFFGALAGRALQYFVVECPRARTPPPVYNWPVIGVLAPFYLTDGGGGTNGYGGMIDGAALAVGQINAAGGINVGGTKENISLDVQDEGAYDLGTGTFNTVTTDKSMTEMLGKDQFIIGGFRTETTTEALTDLATYNTGASSPVPFFISGASTTDLIGPTISGAEDPWVFRVTPVNDTTLFMTVASYIRDSLAPQLARMYCNSTYPTANPGQFRFAVVAEDLTWTAQPVYLLTAPYGAPQTYGYNAFLGPNVTTNDVPYTTGNYPGANFVPAATSYDFTTLVNQLKAADAHLIIDFFTMPEVNDLLTALQTQGVQAMVVGIDVPGQQQSHWADTGGSTTVAGAANYEVNLLWSGTNTPMVAGALPGNSAAFWNSFETYTASIPGSPGAYWPMYTAAGAYEAIYGIKAAIESAGTADTSNPALLAAIENTNMASLSGQFKYAENDVYATDYGINWTQYDSDPWGWARSEVAQWIQNKTVPASPAPNVGAQMNVVSPINLVGPTTTALPYTRRTAIPPSMYSLAAYDLNLDGKVDMKDIATCAAAFGTVAGQARWNAQADVNTDGKVDMKDIAGAAAHFGQRAPQWPLP